MRVEKLSSVYDFEDSLKYFVHHYYNEENNAGTYISPYSMQLFDINCISDYHHMLLYMEFVNLQLGTKFTYSATGDEDSKHCPWYANMKFDCIHHTMEKQFKHTCNARNR